MNSLEICDTHCAWLYILVADFVVYVQCLYILIAFAGLFADGHHKKVGFSVLQCEKCKICSKPPKLSNDLLFILLVVWSILQNCACHLHCSLVSFFSRSSEFGDRILNSFRIDQLQTVSHTSKTIWWNYWHPILHELNIINWIRTEQQQ